jgi:hypothetical protein
VLLGSLAELVIDEGEELVGCGFVTTGRGIEEERGVGGGARWGVRGHEGSITERAGFNRRSLCG